MKILLSWLKTVNVIGSVSVSYTHLDVYKRQDKDSNILPGRFTMVAVIFGILCVVSYLLLCNLTVERVRQTSAAKEPFNYGKVLKSAFKNRPLIGVMIATVGLSLIHI